MRTNLVHFSMSQVVKTLPSSSRFKPYSLSELATLPAPSWLVDDVLPDNSLATIYGRPSEGKTFAALDLALSVATGRRWHGHATKARPVVYMAGEGASGVRTRVEAWEQHHGRQAAAAFFVVKEPVQLLSATEVGELIQEIQAKEIQPGLLVIDTFARSFAGDENSAQDVGSAVSALARIQRALGCTVMVVHHSGKGGGVKRAQERGSSALRGAMDVMIHVVKSGTVVQVMSDKQKDAEDFPMLSLTLHIQSLGVDALGKARSSCVLIHSKAGPAAGGLTASQQAALRALAALPAGPVASTTWLQALSPAMSERTFFAAVKGLTDVGSVRQLRKGRYELAPEGTATATTLQGAAIGTDAATAAITPTPVGGGEMQQALELELVHGE